MLSVLLLLVTLTESLKFHPVYGVGARASATVTAHAPVAYPVVYNRVVPLVPVYYTGGVLTQPPAESHHKKNKQGKRNKEDKFIQYIEKADKLKYNEYRRDGTFSKPINWVFLLLFLGGGGAIAFLIWKGSKQSDAESTSFQSTI